MRGMHNVMFGTCPCNEQWEILREEWGSRVVLRFREDSVNGFVEEVFTVGEICLREFRHYRLSGSPGNAPVSKLHASGKNKGPLFRNSHQILSTQVIPQRIKQLLI